MAYFFICLLIFFKIVNTFYLNSYQMKTIVNLIKNPKLQTIQREKINKILYSCYLNFAIKKAVEFKKLHKHKCRNIKTDELIFSSKIGLFKSIEKYNGNYNFMSYSTIYIKSELLKLLSEKYSLSILPKKIRCKNKTKMSPDELIRYNYLLNVNLFCLYEPYKLEFLLNNNKNEGLKTMFKSEEREKLLEIINNQSSFIKRILYLKYLFKPNQKLSNKIISILMCCSEETIRKSLINLNIS